MPVGVAVTVEVRLGVAVRVKAGVGVKLGRGVWVAVGEGVDDAVAVAVADAVAVCVARSVRVGVLVPLEVGVTLGDGLGVGVHGAANVLNISAKSGMKSRSARARPLKESAPLHSAKRAGSVDAMIAAQKSAAVVAPSQLASARSGRGVGVGMGVSVAVGDDVGVRVGVDDGVSVGAWTGVLWAVAPGTASSQVATSHAGREDARQRNRDAGVTPLGNVSYVTACTQPLPIPGRSAGTGRPRIAAGQR